MGKNNCAVCHSNNLKERRYRLFRGHSIKNVLLSLIVSLRWLYPKSIKKFIPAKIRFFLESPFGGNLVICKDCGYGVIKNPPSEQLLMKFYKKDYWSNRKSNFESVSVKDYSNDLKSEFQIKFVLGMIELSTPLDIMEIGGGPCFSLQRLANNFNNSADINLYSCEPGKQWELYYEQKGIIKAADFYPFPVTKKFNYIHASHWLEHVVDLKQTIIHLKEHLEKGGYIYIEVPNCGGDYWKVPFDHIPHIHFFTSEALKKSFENEGFELINMEIAGKSQKEAIKDESFNKVDYQSNADGIWIRSIFKLP